MTIPLTTLSKNPSRQRRISPFHSNDGSYADSLCIRNMFKLNVDWFLPDLAHWALHLSAGMAEAATEICGNQAKLTDVATLPVSEAQAAVDYTSLLATFAVCRLVDATSAKPSDLLGDDTEHLYQLNHVYVVPPSEADTIKTRDGVSLLNCTSRYLAKDTSHRQQ